MSFTINTNTSARIASLYASKANIALSKSIERLSTGRKLHASVDDAGATSLSYKLSSRTARTEAIVQNSQNAISYLQVQDGALDSLGKILSRFGELRTMAQGITNNSSDIQNYNYEFIELQRQFRSISLGEFNSISLFVTDEPAFAVNRDEDALIDNHTQWGGHTVAFDKFSRDFPLGPGGSQSKGSISISMVNFDFIMAVNLNAINPDYQTREPNGDEYLNHIFAISIGQIDNALAKLASARADNGAEQNAIMKHAQLMQANLTNLEAAQSRIQDADLANESTQFAKHKILTEISTSMNAQANQLTYLGLTLIGVS